MTILEALTSLNSFPIPINAMEKACVDRGLTSSEDYTALIGISEAYELATADIYMWLYGQPSLVEQEVGINQLLEVKKGFLAFANRIYAKYNDDKFSGNTYGYIGENFNG